MTFMVDSRSNRNVGIGQLMLGEEIHASHVSGDVHDLVLTGLG